MKLPEAENMPFKIKKLMKLNLKNYFNKMRKYLLPLSVLIIFQIIFTCTIFPIHKLDLEKPLLYTDHAVHYYQTRQTLDFLRISRRVWGYDPYFMAGYPSTFFNLIGNCGASFTTGILSIFMPLPIAIKVFMLIMLILIPVIIFFSCRNFSFGIPESFLSGLILIVVLNSFWYYKELVGWGLYSFIFSAVVALFSFSCFYRYLRRGEKRVLIYYILSGWYALSLHPLSAIISLCFIISYFVFNYRETFSPKIKYLLAGSCLIVVANLYWIIPLVQFSKYYYGFKHLHLQAFGWGSFLRHMTNPRNIIFSFFVLCSIVIPFFLKREDKNRTLVLSLWAVFLSMYIIAYFTIGSIRSFFAHIEPARFIMVLALLVPILVAQLFFKIFASHTRFITVFFSLILFFEISLCSDFSSKIIDNRDFFINKMFCGNPISRSNIAMDVMDKGGEGLVNKILGLTDNSARILIEDNMYMKVFWGSHFLAMLPYLTGREFIGGPYHNLKVAHRFASFADGEVFFKPITNIGIERFMEYMDLYNIKWAFVHFEKSKQYFQSHPEHFRHISSYRHIDIYLVNREASYFIEGEGDICASLDKITITNASQGNIVIKYHFLETLKTHPMLSIEKFNILDDPIGFIKINNDKGLDVIEISH